MADAGVWDRIRVAEVNVKSLTAHFAEFLNYFAGKSYVVICVPET